MKIQSLSIVVPSTRCVNNCAFCVSKMSAAPYADQICGNTRFTHLYEKEYRKRLAFARDNGCNTMMITGDCEPQQNREFLMRLGNFNRDLSNPFKWIEMQTTGVIIDDGYLRFLREHVEVETISVSISSFSSETNFLYNGTHKSLFVDLPHLFGRIKEYDFNLRLSVNMTDEFDRYTPEEFFRVCKENLADQVTLRVLYASEDSTQAEWVRQHAAKAETVQALTDYVEKNGRVLEKLEFGRVKYSVNGMSIVIDNDCMSTEAKQELKYVILRPNCKLYTKWDDPGSLIF